MKPFLSSFLDRLLSSVSKANSTVVDSQRKEIDEDKSITDLEAFMEAKTDKGVREEALQRWDSHKGCPITKVLHRRKRHAVKSRKRRRSNQRSEDCSRVNVEEWKDHRTS